METTTTQQIIEPARIATRIIPAVYADFVREDVVAPARTEWVVVPGTYRAVRVPVTVAAAQTTQRVVPARFQTTSERVMTRPGYVTWAKGCGTFAFTDASALAGGDDDILCRVDVPPRYETVQRRRLLEAERVETVETPARTAMVQRLELIAPARVEPRMMPAEKRVVKERRLVTPVRAETYTVPAVTKTLPQTRVVRPARTEWREVLCEGERSSVAIRDAQKALKARGYRVAVDGSFGPQTRAAIERFQRENRLATGYITVETLQALGVKS